MRRRALQTSVRHAIVTSSASDLYEGEDETETRNMAAAASAAPVFVNGHCRRAAIVVKKKSSQYSRGHLRSWRGQTLFSRVQ